MSKARRDRSVSRDRHTTPPFTCSSRKSCEMVSHTEEDLKQWEEVRCPVCMEHPHNAVLLICSSHEKGCRPYMCDTSYRHANCLDQFCKSCPETSLQEETRLPTTPPLTTESITGDIQENTNVGSLSTIDTDLCENRMKPKLLCPLCRGQIKEWLVVEDARSFMNAKSRSCSCETCDFSGTYADLRKHARVEHPSSRPSEADPDRQRTWRSLEHQRDLGDLLSTLQSSLGGEERDQNSILVLNDGRSLTVSFLIRVFRPGSSPRSSSSSSARSESSVRATQYDGDEENESSEDVSGTWRRRTRQRSSPDNQP